MWIGRSAGITSVADDLPLCDSVALADTGTLEHQVSIPVGDSTAVFDHNQVGLRLLGVDMIFVVLDNLRNPAAVHGYYGGANWHFKIEGEVLVVGQAVGFFGAISLS